MEKFYLFQHWYILWQYQLLIYIFANNFIFNLLYFSGLCWQKICSKLTIITNTFFSILVCIIFLYRETIRYSQFIGRLVILSNQAWRSCIKAVISFIDNLKQFCQLVYYISRILNYNYLYLIISILLFLFNQFNGIQFDI